MAEFCLDCSNRFLYTNYKEEDVVLDNDLCEGCGEVKPCIAFIKNLTQYQDAETKGYIKRCEKCFSLNIYASCYYYDEGDGYMVSGIDYICEDCGYDPGRRYGNEVY